MYDGLVALSSLEACEPLPRRGYASITSSIFYSFEEIIKSDMKLGTHKACRQAEYQMHVACMRRTWPKIEPKACSWVPVWDCLA
jgi:hypothetical protein